MYSLGINIGSVSVKFAYLRNSEIIKSGIYPHEGNLTSIVKNIFDSFDFDSETKVLVTGNEGRHLFQFNNSPEIDCLDEYLKTSKTKYNAVVSMGGEDIIVYVCDESGSIFDSISGNKCATGTGEFFKQQLGRMNMSINDLNKEDLFKDCTAQKLSTRCSVFMKSDCTHRLNKGQASRGDIVLSLCNVMAVKITEYINKARITNGNILLAGGLSQNNFIINYIKQLLPDINFVIPGYSVFLEAYSAAILAKSQGSLLLEHKDVIKNYDIKFKRYTSLKNLDSKVEYIPAKRGTINPDVEYVLGIDGGSTTTKVCLINIETKEIVADYYNRTHGDPVNALVVCLKEIKNQIENKVDIDKLRISLISTTGSSRELLGVFTGTNAVYNEILAHGKGTSFYYNDVDTIFEIGGQDAKYISIKNQVAIDYAMNEACSAGTGSFLEEAADGDLNIKNVEQIGEIALKSDSPLKFSEHCSAFINAEIRKAIVQGCSKPDITAGLVVSIVSNYLNRVVGNRNIGNKISIQGGVAKNPAVPRAFAMLLNKNLKVPPLPELLGCFGTALIAIEKEKSEIIQKGDYSLNHLINTDFNLEKHITCKSCDNFCSIAVININGTKKMFGGRCSKYTVIKTNKRISNPKNLVAKYHKLLFENKLNINPQTNITVAIPLCFSVFNLFPFYNSFFTKLGVKVLISDDVDENGFSYAEADYCYPAEIAHATVLNVIKKKPDYIFLPHFKDKFDDNSSNHSCTCPITQALPYYIEKAFPELNKSKILSPYISFDETENSSLIKEFIKISKHLGFSKQKAIEAIQFALGEQKTFEKELKHIGKLSLKEINQTEDPVIMLMGRPYNAFTKDANMGIPEKIVSKGYDIVPFNIYADESIDIYDNMYWYYGRQVLQTAKLAKQTKNLYPIYITNFSCAPDSFLLHYLSWIMGDKPYLILELDSHTADAGIDTRIEAFLDIVENYHGDDSQRIAEKPTFNENLKFVAGTEKDIFIYDKKNNIEIPVRNNPDVILLLSNMGNYSTELVAAFVRQYGINAMAFPVADEFTVQTAKDVCSGKECLPAHLVLGSFLQFVKSKDFDKNKTYLLFVPTTTGPCRTGQYFIFYKKILSDLEIDNVAVMTLDSDNSYNELGKGFSKAVWWALLIADYLKDIETTIRACAKDKDKALKYFKEKSEILFQECEKDVKRSIPALKTFAKELKSIKLKYNPTDQKKILVIGEIYVRRDDFAVDELIGHFAEKGIIAKISGISEWIYYCDYVQKTEIFNYGENGNYFKNIFGGNYAEKLKWIAESKYKHIIENKIKNALKPSGLLIDFPDNMDEIMNNCNKHFIENQLYSEISISGGMAYTALHNGYSGVVNISPFACLIGRVIEGIVKPWARQNKKPVISVETDGNPLPLNTINKIDTFTASVLRG